MSDEYLATLRSEFESRDARDVIAWAVDIFHPRLLLATSMTDAVLIDLCADVEPSIEVVFIDTGYHFQETLDMVEIVGARYDIDVRVMRPELPPEPLWKTDPLNCCSLVKVAQLELALKGKDAWMSGLRRAEAPSRADAPIVSRGAGRKVKINPLASWTDLDVQRYVAEHDVPVNPLLKRGYQSIGCWPCTRPVANGDHPRSGRWPGLDKMECGLHG